MADATRPHVVQSRETGMAEQVFRRMARFAREAPLGADPLAQVDALRRAWIHDPRAVLLMAFQHPDYGVVGHAAATIEPGGCLTVHQAVLDRPAGSALAKGMLLADEWGQSRGARFMLIAAIKHPRVWTRRYGFEFFRHLMGRRIGTPIPALKRDHAQA